MFDCKAEGGCLSLCLSFILLLMAEERVAQTACGSFGTCELQALRERQTLTSDNFPDFGYKDNDVTWRISASSGDLVSLTLVSLSTEGSSSCHNTYLQVFDETDGMQFDLTKICPGESSRTYVSSYSSIFIKYVGAPNIRLRFNLKYQSVPNPNGDACTGVPLLVVASASMKNITSPNYPLAYPRNSICLWRIVTQDKDTLVKVHVDKGRLTDCSTFTHDYIQIKNGPTEYDHLETTLCGHLGDHERVSSSHAIYVEFHSGSSAETGEGFHLSYQAIDNERMFSKDLKATREEIEVMYPSYPSNYPNNARVSWKIQSRIDIPIQVTIEYHWIERSSSCEHDFLEVYNGTGEIGSPRLLRLCGVQVSPQSVVSSGRDIFIRFVSDRSVVNKGFKFKFSRAPYLCPNGVTGVLADETGAEITSPGFPNRYPVNVLCQWQVTGTRDIVTFNFEILDMKRETHCKYDYLKIFDGYSPNHALLKTFCGDSRQPLAPFNSTTSVIFIEFRSGKFNSRSRGFKLVVQSMNQSLESGGPTVHPSSDSGNMAAVYVAVPTVLLALSGVAVFMALMLRSRSRTIQRRTHMPTVIIRQQADHNVPDPSSHSAPENTAPEVHTDLPPRETAGIYFSHLPSYSSLKLEGGTAVDGYTDLPPTYTESTQDRQHLIRPSENTPPAQWNSFDNDTYGHGEEARDHSRQPPPNYTTV